MRARRPTVALLLLWSFSWPAAAQGGAGSEEVAVSVRSVTSVSASFTGTITAPVLAPASTRPAFMPLK